jgi:hypothetical protein
MAYVDLPLSDSPDYQYTVALEGDYYTLRFIFNEIMQRYTMMIYDSDNNLLLSGVGLVPLYPIIADYVVGNLTGSFLMLPISDTDVEFYKLYPQKLNKYYTLSYVYEETDQ